MEKNYRHKHFTQEGPRLGNQYLENTFMQQCASVFLPEKFLSEIKGDLERFGYRTVTDLYEMAKEAERVKPVLEKYTGWGEEVNEIHVSAAWKNFHKVSAEERLVKTGYTDEYFPHHRMYQMLKLHLFQPSDGLYSCPLAMTDGAAKVLRGLKGQDPELNAAYDRLTSNDGDKFWTSGQWMTERRGGSDVAAGTETFAELQSDGSYRLYGYKWFSSATTSHMSLALARMKDSEGKEITGTKGLGLFYLPMRKEDGTLNNIEIVRLKDKFGTRQLPTAELILNGTKARLISKPGKGVKSIVPMLHITRYYNSITSVACMRRMLALGRDFSFRRTAFGKLIQDQPLHVLLLAKFEAQYRSCMAFISKMSELLGKIEGAVASPSEEAIFRLMNPVMKMYTAKVSMKWMSEGMEMFGGVGYMENSNIPVILRDCQVTPIWEGTTNVMSLDVLRALKGVKGDPFASIDDYMEATIAAASKKFDTCEEVVKGLRSLREKLNFLCSGEKAKNPELYARALGFQLGRVFIGTVLLDIYTKTGGSDFPFLKFWIDLESGKEDLVDYDFELLKKYALDLDANGKPRHVGNSDVAGKIRAKMQNYPA